MYGFVCMTSFVVQLVRGMMVLIVWFCLYAYFLRTVWLKVLFVWLVLLSGWFACMIGYYLVFVVWRVLCVVCSVLFVW